MAVLSAAIGRATAADIPALADLLIEAVAGGASIGFMAGLTAEAAARFWRDWLTPDNHVLVALDGAGIAGTVSLALAMPPNQPHRADVRKMIVAQRARRQGLGAALLAAAEAAATAHGRTTLVLDTISNSPAARLYVRAGWQRIGEITAFARLPDGTTAPTTIYARHL